MRWVSTGLGLEVSDKSLVRRIIKIWCPEHRIPRAKNTSKFCFLQTRKRQRIHRKDRVKWNLSTQSGLIILLDERRPGRTRVKDKNSVRARCFGFREFCGKIKLHVLTPLGHVFSHDFSLKSSLNTRHHVLTGSVVGRHNV